MNNIQIVVIKQTVCIIHYLRKAWVLFTHTHHTGNEIISTIVAVEWNNKKRIRPS